MILRTLSARFTSRLRSERVAAKLGVWLGLSFTVAFVTGLFSHFMQHPPAWALWPSRPVNLYRVTQGVHVIGGHRHGPAAAGQIVDRLPQAVAVAALPLPRARRGAAGAPAPGRRVRCSSSSPGLLNIAYAYPWPFSFPRRTTGRPTSLYGALVIHVVNEWAKVRRNLWTLTRRGTGGDPARRRFLDTVAAASGLAALLTVGETFAPLARLAVLAPRDPASGRRACRSTSRRSRRG